MLPEGRKEAVRKFRAGQSTGHGQVVGLRVWTVIFGCCSWGTFGAGRLGSPLTLFDFEGPMYKVGQQMGPSLCRRPITCPEDPPIVAIHS